MRKSVHISLLQLHDTLGTRTGEGERNKSVVLQSNFWRPPHGLTGKARAPHASSSLPALGKGPGGRPQGQGNTSPPKHPATDPLFWLSNGTVVVGGHTESGSIVRGVFQQ